MKKLFLMTVISILTGAATNVARAEEASKAYQVEVDPKVYPKKAFEQKHVRVSNIPARVKRPDALPDKREREAAFSAVPGLAQDLAKMDEMDRDILFVRARTKQLKELRKSYPGIEEKKLSLLRDFLRKELQKENRKEDAKD